MLDWTTSRPCHAPYSPFRLGAQTWISIFSNGSEKNATLHCCSVAFSSHTTFLPVVQTQTSKVQRISEMSRLETKLAWSYHTNHSVLTSSKLTVITVLRLELGSQHVFSVLIRVGLGRRGSPILNGINDCSNSNCEFSKNVMDLVNGMLWYTFDMETDFRWYEPIFYSRDAQSILNLHWLTGSFLWIGKLITLSFGVQILSLR